MVRHRRISGSALRWERMHRDAAKALAAQAAEAMATRRAAGAALATAPPSPTAGEGSRPDAQSARTGAGSTGA
jgi:hypothetical protein